MECGDEVRTEMSMSALHMNECEHYLLSAREHRDTSIDNNINTTAPCMQLE